MSASHIRPLAVAFGKAWRLAGPNPNSNSIREHDKEYLMRIDGKDLDAWAKALAVSNDAEAIATLRRDLARIWEAAGILEGLYNRYERNGIVYTDDVNRELRCAAGWSFSAYRALYEVRRAFERHERGAA